MNRKLSIVVFGYSTDDILSWMKRHVRLLNDRRVDFLFAFFHGTVVVDGFPGNFKFLKGCESPVDRLCHVLQGVVTDYCLLVASDDVLLSVPLSDIDVGLDGAPDVIVGNSFFIEDGGGYSPSISNDLDINSGSCLLSFWNYPQPSDNSIFYSIYKTSVLKSVFLRFLGLSFHAMDWAIVHFSLRSSGCFLRRDDFLLVRSKTPPDTYIKRSFSSGSRSWDGVVALSSKKDLIVNNNLSYAFKFILDNDSLLSYSDLSFFLGGWTKWLNRRMAEMVSLGYFSLSPGLNGVLSVEEVRDIMTSVDLENIYMYYN